MTAQRLLIVEDDPALDHSHATIFTAEVSEKPFQIPSASGATRQSTEVIPARIANLTRAARLSTPSLSMMRPR